MRRMSVLPRAGCAAWPSARAAARSVHWATAQPGARSVSTDVCKRQDVAQEGALPAPRLELGRETARQKIAAVDAERPPLFASPFLRDRHARQHTYLRISLTERCNLRCVYCMPEEGVTLTPAPELLTAQEVQRLATLFVANGVDKIRLTGGEPTVRRDLEEIVASLKDLRSMGLRSIGMTSNGLALARRLPGLVDRGLSHLNVSLDTFDPFKFELLTRRPPGALDAVLKTLDTAEHLRASGSGLRSVKINVVVLKGVNDSREEIRSFLEYTRDRDIVVRFIEYMPFDGNKWQSSKLVPYQDLLALIRDMYGPLERLQDDANDTSKHWRVPGYAGSIGFITSMTDHFCGTCNRLRITADGNMKVCLFGNSEVSLRDVMRGSGPEGQATDEELLRVIGAAVGRKHAKHAASQQKSSSKQRSTPANSFRLAPPGRLPIGPRRAAVGLGAQPSRSRFYSSRSGDDNPWTRAGAGIRGSAQVQTWSEYMGQSHLDEDDNPWANLDAFADSAIAEKAAAKTPSASAPSTAPQRDGAASTASVAEQAERMMMEAAVARMLAEQDRISPATAEPRAPPSAPAEQPRRSVPPPPASAASGLTHYDRSTGQVRMVDVSDKPSTARTATASGRIWLPRRAMDALRAAEQPAQSPASQSTDALGKGPVLQTAQLAGIMGAKRTADLIPLCHPLGLSSVSVQLACDDDAALDPDGGYVVAECTARTSGQTGVEMEALTGASVALLTVWDMVKALAGKEMVIEDLKVTAKSGGKSGDWRRS